MAKPDGIAILNGAQKLMIEFANREGIALSDSFATVDAFKEFVWAFTVKALVDQGLSVADALDATLGEGSYDRLAESVWQKCQPTETAAS